MRINVTFRHMETSEPVRNYVEEKLPKVKKYIDEPVEAQVVPTQGVDAHHHDAASDAESARQVRLHTSLEES